MHLSSFPRPALLKEIAAKHFPEQMGDLKGYLKQTAELVRISAIEKQLKKYGDSFRIAREMSLRRIYTDIDLLIHKLKKASESAAMNEKQNIFNINAPVGSIQTGNNSSASVTQNFDTSARDTIAQALSIIQEVILKEDNLPEQPKEKILEIIQESQDEISKDKPNVTKLRGFFAVLSSSAQILAALKPTYEIIKPAFILLGIPLP